jgi:hypothetical protein
MTVVSLWGRDLTRSQEHRLDELEEDGGRVIGWDARLGGPVVAFRGRVAVVDRRGFLVGRKTIKEGR